MALWLVWCGLWKLALRDAAARRQGDSRCVCSDGGAVGGRFAAPGGAAGAAGGAIGDLGALGALGGAL